MKTKFLACSILLALLAGSSLALLNNKKVVNETEAYSTSSLPTTIDLNDTSAADIRSYYSSLNSLTANERKGTNLLKNLKTILKNEQKYYSYDSGNGIWQLYEITDRDWVKSPASSTVYGTYDSVNNKLIDYTYGTSNSNGKNNPYIHALYINRNVDNQTLAWGNHNQDEWGINREHVWPKSLGFEDVGDGGARGDPMHLMAGNGYSNNIHSNYFYGYVDTDSSYTDCGTKYSNQYGNLRGTSLTKGSGMVFEPQDCDKGDIARAIFYMVARYNYLSGSDSDGIDSNNPNLTLVQESTCNETYVSTTTYPGRMGVLTDLLAWHHADPVDEFEIHRNNLLYTNYTNNRNPFIDFPEWVDYIWGTASYSGNQYQSYDSTPTGTANPSSDTINGYNSYSGTVVSISVSDQNTTFTVGDAFSFGGTVTAHYDNSTTKDVTSEATFTGYDMSTAGNQTVTVTYSGKTTTYQITVNEPSGNEPIDAEMSNGSYCYTSTVNGRPAIKMGTASTAGNMRVTVGEGATSLSFYAAAWKGETNNTINITGATVNPSSVSITADSGISGSSSDYTLYASESVFLHEIALSNITSTTTLTLSVGGDGKRAVVWSPKYTCVNKEVTSISATPNKTFYVGETITKSDILVIDNNNAPITDFNFTSYQFTYEDAQSGGALHTGYSDRA